MMFENLIKPGGSDIKTFGLSLIMIAKTNPSGWMGDWWIEPNERIRENIATILRSIETTSVVNWSVKHLTFDYRFN
ncbi:MAG: hypothetical protein ACTS5A_00515 [Candidatus Hodgkinia cicadicola]